MKNASQASSDTGSAASATRPATGGALASLALAMLLSSLATSVANVALPTLAGAFEASFQQVQWVVLAYLLGVTTLIVSAGRLGDLVGRRRLLLAGISLFTAASVACGLAPTLPALVAGRAAQGLGAAVMLGLAMALVGQTVPPERTGRAMGLLGATSAIGTSLGPSLGGLLIEALGWRAVFLVTAPLGLVALLLARRLPVDRRRAASDSARFDVTGALLLALTLAAYALAVTGRSPDPRLLGASGAGLALFVLTEARAPSPLLDLALLRRPALRGGLATSALVSTVIMTTLVVGPFHLSRALGLAPAIVGLVMTAGPLTAALAGVPAGRLVDHLGARSMTLAGLFGLAAGALALSMAPLTLGLAGYVVPLVVTTGGYALFQTANNTAVMADVAAEQRGVVSGALNLSRNLGLLTGASLMGSVFAAASSAVDVATASPDAVAGATRTTFAVAAALIVVAVGVAASAGAATDRPRLRSQPC